MCRKAGWLTYMYMYAGGALHVAYALHTGEESPGPTQVVQRQQAMSCRAVAVEAMAAAGLCRPVKEEGCEFGRGSSNCSAYGGGEYCQNAAYRRSGLATCYLSLARRKHSIAAADHRQNRGSVW